MAGFKTLFNTQFGRVLTALASAVPSADNEGREPSLTPQGAMWVKIDGALPAGVTYTSKSLVSSAALSAGAQLYTGTADILEFYGFKQGTSSLRFLQIFDSLAAPAPGAVPLISIALPGEDTVFSLSHAPIPVASANLATGLRFALSSTAAIYTAPGTGTVWVNALMGVI